ncbi:MAG: cupin domain-containing protein [Hyphomicrobiaceae bacterium]
MDQPPTFDTETYRLLDDGTIPNNERLPLVVYRGAFELRAVEPETTIVERLEKNNWGGAWIDGIYPFHHYHARSHEVLVIAAGSVDVQMGGPRGPILTLTAGDAMVVPAGVGHCRVAARGNLSVVGAYPPGQRDWDLKRATAADRAVALAELAVVKLPSHDPIVGAHGPLLRLWKRLK